MKALHTVLICLIIFAIFNYTAATLTPSIQRGNNPILKENNALHNSLKASPREKPGLIILGDPIDDPKPH